MVLFIFPVASHAVLDDGIYEVEYEVLTAEADEVSIANDYFDKPASLIIQGGERTLQLPINHAHWVVGLKTPVEDDFQEVDTLEEDEKEDKRIVQFPVDENHNLKDPIEINMHIIVDTLEDYDHHYTTFFDFDEDSAEKVEEPLSNEEAMDNEANEGMSADQEGKGISNTILIPMVAGGALVIAFLIFLFYKKKRKNKPKS